MRLLKDKTFSKFVQLVRRGEIEEHYRLVFKNLHAVIYILNTRGQITYLSSYVEKISHYRTSELIGKNFTEIVAPESQAIAAATYKRQLQGHEIKPYELAVIDKFGKKIHLKVSESVLRHQGKVIGVLGIGTDITEQKSSTEHLTKMVKEFGLLYEIGTELTAIIDVDVLFSRILSLLRHTFGYERVSILLVDEDTKVLTIKAVDKILPRRLFNRKIVLGKGITGYVAQTGIPYLANDLNTEPRYIKIDSRSQSEACVPLKIGGRVIGVINIESYHRNAFDKEDIRALSLIANQAAVAIENGRLYKSLEDSYFDTIRTLISAMEAKDHETRGHSDRVRILAVKMARRLALNDAEISKLNHAGYLHDIGKIGISDFILNKKEPLTKSEFRTIRKHPKIGFDILKGVRHLAGASKIIRSEHEKYDGSGYPDGLRGPDIPIGARIMAVADAYDAMITDRPYRKALPKKEAIRRLKENAGTQFDPRVVRIFLSIIARK